MVLHFPIYSLQLTAHSLNSLPAQMVSPESERERGASRNC